MDSLHHRQLEESTLAKNGWALYHADQAHGKEPKSSTNLKALVTDILDNHRKRSSLQQNGVETAQSNPNRSRQRKKRRNKWRLLTVDGKRLALKRSSTMTRKEEMAKVTSDCEHQVRQGQCLKDRDCEYWHPSYCEKHICSSR